VFYLMTGRDREREKERERERCVCVSIYMSYLMTLYVANITST